MDCSIWKTCIGGENATTSVGNLRVSLGCTAFQRPELSLCSRKYFMASIVRFRNDFSSWNNDTKWQSFSMCMHNLVGWLGQHLFSIQYSGESHKVDISKIYIPRMTIMILNYHLYVKVGEIQQCRSTRAYKIFNFTSLAFVSL